MNGKYPLIAAAVAAALGAAGFANAAPPSLATAASAPYQLVVSGSSAAQSSIQNAFEKDACGGAANALSVQSAGNKNFFAFSCTTTAAIGGVPSGQVVTIYYRSEGGSVTGALPIATGKPIKRLLLTDGSCTSAASVGTCNITGVTATNGPNDSWTGAVTTALVQLGVTDVEPSQLIGLDYPSNYATSVFGSASPTQMAALTTAPAVQQVFGLGVNTSGMTLNPANDGNINLSAESIAGILSLNYTDWNSVPDALTGKPITTNSVAITRIDREPGSGTRTQANIYFLHYLCSASGSAISNNGSEQLNYSTGDELTQANGVGGSIAYASIDNLLQPKVSSYTNLHPVYINGIAPSTLAAATGQYDDWFEATLVIPSYSIPANAQAVSSWLQGDLPNLAAAPAAADINVIPNVGTNTATVPLTGTTTGTITVYVNPFTRSGSSCNVPVEQN